MSLTPKDIEILNARLNFERSLYNPNAGKADGYFNTKPAPPPPLPIPRDVNNNAVDGWSRIEKGFTAPRELKNNPGFNNAPNPISANQGNIPTSAGGRSSSAVPPRITAGGGASGLASGIVQTLAPGLIQQGPNYLNPNNPKGIFAPDPTVELLRRYEAGQRSAPPGYDRNLDGSLAPNPFKILFDPRSDGSPLNPNGLWNPWRDRLKKTQRTDPTASDDPRFKTMGGVPAPFPRATPNGIKGPFDISDKFNPFKPKPGDPNAPFFPGKPNSNIPDSFAPQDKIPSDFPPFRGGNIAGKRYTVFFTGKGQRTYTNPYTGGQAHQDIDTGVGRAEGLIGPLGRLEVTGESYTSAFGDRYIQSTVWITQAFGTPNANRTQIYSIGALDAVVGISSWAVPGDGSIDDGVNPNAVPTRPVPAPSLPPNWSPPAYEPSDYIDVSPPTGDRRRAPIAPAQVGDRPSPTQQGSPDGRPQSPPQLELPQIQQPQTPQVQQPQLPQIQQPPETAKPPFPFPKPSSRPTIFPPSFSSDWSDPPFPGPYTKTKTDIEKDLKNTKEFAPYPIPPIFPNPVDPNGRLDKPRQEEEERRQEANKPLPQPKPRCQNSCSAGLEMGQEEINGKLDKTLKALDAGANLASLALLPIINNKLGDQIPGGIGGKLTRLSQWLHLDRALNVLTYVNTLHNAYMLSNGLTQTLFSMISNVLAAVGIKDAENNPLDISSIIDKSVEAFAKSVLGVATVDGMKAEWKKYSRIYQAASNLLWSIQSIGQSILGALEIVGSMVAKIGNAMRKWGVISEKAFGWMNQSPNYQNRFFTTIEKVEEVTSNIDSIAGEVLSVQDTITQIGTQKTELEKSLKQDEGTKQGKESPEANKLKESEDKNKTDSKPPTIPVEAERKPTA